MAHGYSGTSHELTRTDFKFVFTALASGTTQRYYVRRVLAMVPQGVQDAHAEADVDAS